MGIKKIGGFIFKTYEADHRPYHVHIYKDGKELGKFDIENQEPMTTKLVITKSGKLRRALRAGGYLI